MDTKALMLMLMAKGYMPKPKKQEPDPEKEKIDEWNKKREDQLERAKGKIPRQ